MNDKAVYDWSWHKFTDREKLFIFEYLIDKNMTQAAIRAGYSEKNAEKIGHQVYHKDHIKHAIDWHLSQMLEKIEITAERVLQEIAMTAFLDPRMFFGDANQLKNVSELDEASARGLSSLEVVSYTTDDGDVEYTKKVKFNDKIRALELLGRNLKMFTDKIEVSDRPKVIVRDLTGRKKAKTQESE